MIGGNHHGVIVTHVDKASKFLVADLGKNKTSSEVNKVTVKFFTRIPKTQRKTMIFDNGKEFSGHAELSKKLGLLWALPDPWLKLYWLIHYIFPAFAENFAVPGY